VLLSRTTAERNALLEVFGWMQSRPAFIDAMPSVPLPISDRPAELSVPRVVPSKPAPSSDHITELSVPRVVPSKPAPSSDHITELSVPRVVPSKPAPSSDRPASNVMLPMVAESRLPPPPPRRRPSAEEAVSSAPSKQDSSPVPETPPSRLTRRTTSESSRSNPPVFTVLPIAVTVSDRELSRSIKSLAKMLAHKVSAKPKALRISSKVFSAKNEATKLADVGWASGEQVLVEMLFSGRPSTLGISHGEFSSSLQEVSGKPAEALRDLLRELKATASTYLMSPTADSPAFETTPMAAPSPPPRPPPSSTLPERPPKAEPSSTPLRADERISVKREAKVDVTMTVTPALLDETLNTLWLQAAEETGFSVSVTRVAIVWPAAKGLPERIVDLPQVGTAAAGVSLREFGLGPGLVQCRAWMN
jgi:hypothetical protein